MALSILPLPYQQAGNSLSINAVASAGLIQQVETFFKNTWQGIFTIPAHLSPLESASPTAILPSQPVPPPQPSLPKGNNLFHIIQGENVWPKITQADINPVDVHVNDTQTFNLTIESLYPIVSAEALITTDHKKIKVDLQESTTPDLNAFLPTQEYALNAQNQLILAGKTVGSPIGKASAEENIQTFYFTGSWKVEDTHNTTYQTEFIVADSSGEIGSVTLAWSDACGIPNDGSLALSSNCTISSVDGVDNGNFTVNTGTTLTLDSTFAYNPGKTVTINGAIAIGTGGQIKKTYLWMIDADGDGYSPSSTQYAQNTAPVGGRRRYLIVQSQYDCSDSDASIYPGVITSYGACSSCTYSSTCATSGTGTQSYTYCADNGTYETGSGSSCTCTRSTNGTSCGSWSSCSGSIPSGSCSASGTKTRPVCSSGSCSGSESQSCTLTAANGASCGSSTYSCPGPGVNENRTDYTCSSGSCVSNTVNLGCVAGACSAQCCSDSNCSAGSYCDLVFICEPACNSCSGGTACNSCSSAEPWQCSCSNYHSGRGYESCSSVQNCSSCGCPPTSYGSCGSCSYPSTCSNTGTGSRTYTSYSCSGGSSCSSSNGNQSCTCTRNTNGTSCNSNSYTSYYCSGSSVYRKTCTDYYTCSSGSCSYSSTSCGSGTLSQSCTCGCGGGSCNTVYSCNRCSDTYSCTYASFNSCSSSCTSPFNVNYSYSTGCNNLCGVNPCCPDGTGCGPCN